MAYENVRFVYDNFCTAPIVGEFCSIDHSTNIMYVKNSSGDLIKSYDLDTDVLEIKSLEYLGPKGLTLAVNQLGEELPFFTLEHIDSDNCLVRQWKLSTANSRLELNKTITKTSIGSYYFDCYDMSVEYYYTEFDGATATGTGYITVDNVGIMEVGDKLLLGPSNDVDNLYAFEWVEITSINGSDVYITASGIVPPRYEYHNEDKITYYKNIFIFSDIGQNSDLTRGSLYKVDPNNGSVLDIQNNGLYSGIRASAWSDSYQSIGLVKGSSLLYIDPNNDYQIQKSHTLTNIEDDDVAIIPIYDLIFDSNIIYRLQQKITLVNDDGDKTTTTWATYNYHQDTLAAYTKNIVLSIDPAAVILHTDQIEITAVVKDQFGTGLIGKLIYFTRSGGDPNGSFDPINGQATTNSNGIATILYNAGDYDLSGTNANLIIKAKTDGASTLTGSQYVWDSIPLNFYSNFNTEVTLVQYVDELDIDIYLKQQIDGMENEVWLRQLSKFQFPGGHWATDSPPSDNTKIIKQIIEREDTLKLDQLKNVDIEARLFQEKEISDDLQLSQTYISRHLSSGHKDDVNIDQFKFIEDAIPAFWSEKNSINTNIWIHLLKFAFDLNKDTLIFRIREVSYSGDTGYIDVTSSCVTTFNPIDGSVQVTYNPPNDFHHNAIVYISIEIYDNAPVPNIILTDYWFKVIADYRAPYIINENPAREEEDVTTNTNISFDLLDAGTGVDINTLEFYVNNRAKHSDVSAITGGYHVSYNPGEDFYYGETVEITVKVKDVSNYQNMLYDMWRFYIVGSTGPWIDRGSFNPKACAKGIYRKRTGISFNIYGIDDTGVDRESILVTIGGKERNVRIIPIIYRLE